MRVLWFTLDNSIEVKHGLLVSVYHLIGFSPFVDVNGLSRTEVDAAREGEDRFFEFFKPAVGEPDVVKDIRFVSVIRLSVQTGFQFLNSFFELIACIQRQSKLIQDSWIVFVFLKRFFELLD